MTSNMIKHHLTDDLLMCYAAGTLPEAFSLVVATHISVCDECRARMGSYDAVGGAVLDNCGVVAVSDGCLIATLKRIAKARAFVPHRQVPGLFPTPLRAYVGGDLSAVCWRAVGVGLRQARLRTDGAATARLVHIRAGCAVPDHGHRGRELTLVLRGAFSDETGRFGPGDVEVADDRTDHRQTADASGDCICLAATDAPLKFRGWLPRLVQPFVGI